MRKCFPPTVAVVLAALLTVPRSAGEERRDTGPVTKGLRVFSCGHSFHVFMPGILTEMARSAGLKDHTMAGLSSIGGSRVIQHWDIPMAKNRARTALREGRVDVLTLSPIYPPDAGIDNFARLAFEHNPNIRVTVQVSWLPWDLYDPTFKIRPRKVDHDAPSIEELRKRHEPYFRSLDEYVRKLNKQLGKPVLFIAPVGQAVLALRAKIVAGKAPGLTKQSDLFTDAIGHARPPLQALIGYCYFALIYRRSPVGLPMPSVLSKARKPEWDDRLNRLLQELAWEAVTQHPLSGVSKGS